MTVDQPPALHTYCITSGGHPQCIRAWLHSGECLPGCRLCHTTDHLTQQCPSWPKQEIVMRAEIIDWDFPDRAESRFEAYRVMGALGILLGGAAGGYTLPQMLDLVTEATDARTADHLRRLIREDRMPSPLSDAYPDWYRQADIELSELWYQLPQLPAPPPAPEAYPNVAFTDLPRK